VEDEKKKKEEEGGGGGNGNGGGGGGGEGGTDGRRVGGRVGEGRGEENLPTLMSWPCGMTRSGVLMEGFSAYRSSHVLGLGLRV